ncbi:maleylpyruvate isomerase N-terminal domain-containing protein [Streptacidiphilus sp. PAMC 29251]
MELNVVMAAFRSEADRLGQVVEGFSEADWRRPTGCVPWSVADLLAHVSGAVGRLPPMLAERPPARAEVSAADYYRPDGRFSLETNALRIASAQQHAGGPALVQEFAAVREQVDKLCAAEPDTRVVRTRHGDPMLLSAFMLTRVVELAVHGLDLAAALDRDPWMTPQAADLVEGLLLGPGRTAADAVPEWDRITFLRKATGRLPISAGEAGRVERSGVTWLTLG